MRPWVVLATLCLAASGCNDTGVIWSSKSPSPDGRWIASAQVIQHGGPGTAGDETVIYLASADDPERTQLIASFFDAWPEIKSLKLAWRSPSRLEVTYKGRPEVTFQAIKFGNVTIDVKPR